MLVLATIRYFKLENVKNQMQVDRGRNSITHLTIVGRVATADRGAQASLSACPVLLDIIREDLHGLPNFDWLLDFRSKLVRILSTFREFSQASS